MARSGALLQSPWRRTLMVTFFAWCLLMPTIASPVAWRFDPRGEGDREVRAYFERVRAVLSSTTGPAGARLERGDWSVVLRRRPTSTR